MAANPHSPSRLNLPARIRSGKLPPALALKLALADRIAQMPGICVLENESGLIPGTVEVYLCTGSDSAPGRPQLCQISARGIRVYGLGDWDKHQILSRGWGNLTGKQVLLFLPRDDEELELCWLILQQAREALLDETNGIPRQRIASPCGLPQFSRSTHA